MATDLAAGSELAGFRIQVLLARGGMGVVYHATQLSLERPVALKVVAPDLSVEEEFRRRFLREVRIAASLDHPHVRPVYEAGEADGVLYLAMRLVDGESLSHVLEREGALEPGRTATIVTQVAEALEAAHVAGLVHRDVKPANVLLARASAREHVYLCDFGVARRSEGATALTKTGGFVGSIVYAAPEQITGAPIDARTDLYALGCLLYECLTGEPPFPREHEAAVLWAHLNEPPPLPSETRAELGDAFDGIVERSLAKDPGARFQSVAELASALASDAPPAPRRLSTTPVSTNLPRPASSFVGRERELQEVISRIEAGARLLTLTGTGGTGKTRLALEAASSFVADYNTGVFWVGLAALRDPALVPEAIAQTLGATDGLAEHIGEQELLLLLDNLEHVIEAAPELGSLLSACPNLTILVTSRELLRIQGEVEYSVPPLAEPDSIALFCARSGLEPSAEIVELCARLDSLPLAVELAAARTKALSPAQILERLSDRLDLLTGGRDADPRQQTLRATLEWSYDLLSPAEQELFARLSVFAGGCTLEAAEEVAGADLDTLQSLAEKSLLRFSNERYWMLETIREYAEEALVKNAEAEDVAERHAKHFLGLAETAEPELWAQHTDPWLPRLDVEEANFRAALGWAIRGEEAEVAVRIAGSLYPFWEIRARHGEARGWLDRALALGGAVDPGRRARALVAAGRATSWQFDWPTAITLLDEAAELSRKLDDLDGVGRCLGFIGHLRLFTGDIAGAAEALSEGVELARSTGDHRALARALYNAAWVPTEERDFDRAREMFEEAAGIARAEDMKPNLALCLMRLGYSEALAGHFESAASRLSEAVVLLDELGVTLWTPVAHRYLGLLALLRGRIDEAESILRTSLMEGREQAPRFDFLHWIDALAAVAAANGEVLRAATLWGANDSLFEQFGLAALEENRQLRGRFRGDIGRALDSDRAEAWAPGRAMTLQQAITYALSEEAMTGMPHVASAGFDLPVPAVRRDTAAPAKTILPTPASSFLGRERELADVASRIEQGARLVTLTGPGGTGKTRLALQAASSLAGRYCDGVFWVGLATLRDPALVAETIAQTLAAKGSLASHIAERELLLLLDNLEQVIEAAPELSELLRACPNLTLLVTSRELLRISGEVEYAVPPLVQPEAIELFCERSGLEPSDEIAELCARLDLLPLAVELAAARTKALSPAQILERLSGRLDLLKGGRDADPRQQTLRATIEWSYELLTSDEQQLFARLSVFAGGCALEAAEEVAGADLDTLQSLVEKSLLRFTQGRYWMLETIREFASEALGDEQQRVASMHADHYARLVVELGRALRNHDPEAMAVMDAEIDNSRAGLAFALASRDARLAGQLIFGLWFFMLTRGFGREAEQAARSWLALERDDLGAEELCMALAAVGEILRNTESDAREEALTLSASLKRELLDVLDANPGMTFVGRPGDALAAAIHADLAMLSAEQGDLAVAGVHADEALEIRLRLGEPWGVSHALGAAAVVAEAGGEFRRARDLWRRVVAHTDDHPEAAAIALSIAEMDFYLGEVGSATACILDSLAGLRALHDRGSIAGTARIAGLIAVATEDLRSGTILLGANRALLEQAGLVDELSSHGRSALDEAMRTARAGLGDEFERLLDSAVGLSDDEVIDLVAATLGARDPKAASAEAGSRRKA